MDLFPRCVSRAPPHQVSLELANPNPESKGLHTSSSLVPHPFCPKPAAGICVCILEAGCSSQTLNSLHFLWIWSPVPIVAVMMLHLNHWLTEVPHTSMWSFQSRLQEGDAPSNPAVASPNPPSTSHCQEPHLGFWKEEVLLGLVPGGFGSPLLSLLAPPSS